MNPDYQFPLQTIAREERHFKGVQRSEKQAEQRDDESYKPRWGGESERTRLLREMLEGMQ